MLLWETESFQFNIGSLMTCGISSKALVEEDEAEDDGEDNEAVSYSLAPPCRLGIFHDGQPLPLWHTLPLGTRYSVLILLDFYT